MLYDVTIDGKRYRLDIQRSGGGWSCRLNGRELEVDAVSPRPSVLSIRIGNIAYEAKAERVAGEWHIWVGSTKFTAEVSDPRSLRGRARAREDHGPKKIVAPMPGKVVRLLVQAGAEVKSGGGIAVVEAMKMQNEIRSPKNGTVQVLVAEGAAVNAGDVLAVVE